LLDGHDVAALTTKTATIRTASGALQTFRRVKHNWASGLPGRETVDQKTRTWLLKTELASGLLRVPRPEMTSQGKENIG
jgi:hypothetical protein